MLAETLLLLLLLLCSWGANAYGQLGQGDTLTRGTTSETMGDKLPKIDLGATERAKAVVVGAQHTCVLLEGGSIKCFGGNEVGQLGIETTKAVGTSPEHMGRSLGAVHLGGSSATAISAGSYHTCAVVEEGMVKW